MNGRTLLYRLAATTVAGIASLTVAGSAFAAPTWLDPVTFPAKQAGVTPLDVAADGDGNVLALWSTFDGNPSDMPLQAAYRPAGGAWGDPQPLGRATGGSARAAFDAAGTAYLVWDAPDGTVQYAIKPRGGGFDVHPLAGTADHPAAHGRVAVSAAGVATFTWQRFNQPGGTSYIQAVVRSPGTGFGPTVDVTSTENTLAPEIGGNRAGDVTIIWRYVPSPGVTGFGSARVVNGAFANHENWTRFTPETVYTTPRPVVDDLGRATAVWAQSGPGGNQLRTATRDSSGAFGIPDDPLDTAVSILNPDIAIAPDGTVVLAWQRFNQGHPATYGIAASARAPGGSFSSPQQVAQDGPTTVDGPAVAADATSTLLVAWSRGGIIQSAARLPGAGQFGGASPVSRAGNATIPRLAADGHGDVAAIWRVLDASGSFVQLGTAGRDGAPPVITQATIPASGRPGQALPFAAGATDVWSPVSYGWSFGDGATAAGASTTHAFAPLGAFGVSLTATDAAGNAATATGTTAISVPSLACPPTGRADGRAIGVTANQAAKYTRNPRVQLTIVPPDGATAAILSNDGGFGRPATQPLGSAGKLPWTLLSSGPERLPKTVYMRFSGPCIDGTQTFQDDIILDQTPPKLTSARLTAAKGVRRSTLKLAAKDNASGLSKTQVRYRLRRKVQIFVAKFHRQVKLNGGPAKVAVRVSDGAGNFSRWKTVSAHR